ncbi:retrovirus-related pol polyprotein from transposon TNT 1-94 [Tanacetum coccineum]
MAYSSTSLSSSTNSKAHYMKVRSNHTDNEEIDVRFVSLDGNSKGVENTWKDSKSSPDAGFKPSGKEEKKDAEDPGNESGNPTEGKYSEVPSIEEPRINQEKNDNINSTNNINIASDRNSTNNVNVVSSTVNAAGSEVNDVDPKTSIELLNDPNVPELEDIVYSDDDEDVGEDADMNNLDTFILNQARLVAQGYTQEKGIYYDEVFAPVARIEAISPILKVPKLHDVEKIFRYLKGQPKLGLWYPKDLPFDLVAYTDNNYARARLDRKSTTELFNT